MKKKKKKIWAYLDGKKLVEVIQAALSMSTMRNKSLFCLAIRR